MTEQEPQVEGFELLGVTTPLFKEEISIGKIKEGLLPRSIDPGTMHGRQAHPIDMANAVQTMYAVSTQETCIMTKRDATVGLGFETKEQRKERKKNQEEATQPTPASPAAKPKPTTKAMDGEDEDSKVDEVLDDLCEVSFQSLINQVGEDYENTGNGYFEVQRDEDTGPIVSMWHNFSPAVYIYLETDAPNFHFEVDGPSGTVKFAKFGDLEGFKKRNPDHKNPNDQLSEMVQFKMPTSANPHYGVPQWLGCVPWLEIAQHMMSFESDYYQNRSVPDLLMFVKNMNLIAEEQEKFKEMIKECVGPGKRHRSMAFFLPGVDTEVQIERLSNENREKLTDSWSAVELAIVSSHRVPPLLAGIITPGKMAASNELPNALVAFQTLYVGQHQKIFRRVLGRTLGSKESGLDLKPTDFLPRRITDFYDLGQMDTMARMKQPVAGSGRDLSQGLKK